MADRQRFHALRPVLWMVASMTLVAALVAGCGRDGTDTAADSAGPPPEAGELEHGASGDEITGKMVIFHAASLARPFEAMESLLEERHPGLDIIRESSSSRIACRKVSELGRNADILASADYTLIRDLLMPDHASWYAAFARNRVVIGYTDRARYHTEINADNWYKVLAREDVQFGMADPDMAPVGYRTLLCWKLAEIYYGDDSIFETLQASVPEDNVRPHCNELIPLVQSLELDYIFEYQSVAKQHNLQHLRLPDEIDLSNEKLADYYAQVSVEIEGDSPGETVTRTGKPIVYGITLLEDAQNRPAAMAFLKLLLSEEGQQIMRDNYQEPVVPAIAPDITAIPEELTPFVGQAEL